MITECKIENDVLIVGLAGSLDVSVQAVMKEKIAEITLREQQNDLVLDFHQVNFIDSSCLGALVSLAKKMREKKGNMKIARMSDDVRAIFQITRLDRVFDIFESIEEAVESYYG